MAGENSEKYQKYTENSSECPSFYIVYSTKNLKLKAEGKKNIVNVFKLIKIHKCKANTHVWNNIKTRNIWNLIIVSPKCFSTVDRRFFPRFLILFASNSEYVANICVFFLWKKLNTEKKHPYNHSRNANRIGRPEVKLMKTRPKNKQTKNKDTQNDSGESTNRDKKMIMKI